LSNTPRHIALSTPVASAAALRQFRSITAEAPSEQADQGDRYSYLDGTDFAEGRRASISDFGCRKGNTRKLSSPNHRRGSIFAHSPAQTRGSIRELPGSRANTAAKSSSDRFKNRWSHAFAKAAWTRTTFEALVKARSTLQGQDQRPSRTAQRRRIFSRLFQIRPRMPRSKLRAETTRLEKLRTLGQGRPFNAATLEAR